MSGAEIAEFGASRLGKKSGLIFAQGRGEEVDDDEAPDYGQMPMFNCLGILSRPAPADERGSAQGIVFSTTGFDAVCVGATDVRTTDMAGDLEPGDTAILGTSREHQCRTVYKKKRVVTQVGDDMVFDLDREAEHILISAFKMSISMTKKDGLVLTTGDATLSIKGGVIMANGQCILGGRTPVFQPLVAPPSPAGFPTPLAPAPIPLAKGVFIGG